MAFIKCIDIDNNHTLLINVNHIVAVTKIEGGSSLLLDLNMTAIEVHESFESISSTVDVLFTRPVK